MYDFRKGGDITCKNSPAAKKVKNAQVTDFGV